CGSLDRWARRSLSSKSDLSLCVLASTSRALTAAALRLLSTLSYALRVKIVEYIEKGMKTSEIRRLTGAPESTIRTLKQKKGTIKQQMDIGKKHFATHERMSADTSEYHKIITITKAYLSRWLSRRVKEDASVSGPELCEQARVIYSALCKKENISSPPSFKASVGWLVNFKKRCQVKLVKYHGEIASADISGADSFPAIAKQIVEDGGYSYEQIYNCDETGFYWKTSPTTMYMHKTEKQAKGTKLARYQKPHAYRNQDMNKLNVYWEKTAKGYMEKNLSKKWFEKYFIPDARAHCRHKNLDFKVLLFMDFHPNVQACFLPANTTSKIQPLDS
ncbi:Tigger transposable element-derived protein 1-like 95, partial [Homarus americanus]